MRYDQDSKINITEYEETMTGRPNDTSVQNAPVTINVNVDAV